MPEGLLAAGTGLMLADQGSKVAAARRLGKRTPGGRSMIFVWAPNPRGSLIGLPLSWAIGLWLAALAAVIGGLWIDAAGSLGSTGWISLGFLLGGAAGNLIDRVRFGAVIDFIALGRWPPFNLADGGIVVGAILLVVSVT
jgi:signal peptidase II